MPILERAASRGALAAPWPRTRRGRTALLMALAREGQAALDREIAAREAAEEEDEGPPPEPEAAVDHEVTADGRARVRLSIAVEDHAEPLAGGPLTAGECATWEVPCQLYGCRHRLDDAIEQRTRAPREEDDVDGLEGPRLETGAYWSDTELAPGHWCALRVAERGGVSLEELGGIYGVTREAARKMIEQVLDRVMQLDTALGARLEQHYGLRGRAVKRRFEELDDDLTSAEVRRLRVPGEPARGKVAPRLPKRRSRKDPWEGVTRVIPAELADRVDVRLLNPMKDGPDAIPERFLKPLSPPGRRAPGS